MSETNQFLESDKNNSTETKKTTFGDINSFNETLQEFLKLDQEIKKLYAAVKSRREKKQQLSEIILIFLKKNEIESVKSGRDITVHEEVSEVKTGFNRENVNNVLMDYFQNNVEDYEKIMKKIEEKIVTKKTTKVKVSKATMTKRKQKDLEEQVKYKQIESLLNELF